MNDARAVHHPQRLARLPKPLQRTSERQTLFSGQQRSEILAAEELHDDVGHLLMEPVVVDLDDVRALEPSGGPSLLPEALLPLAVPAPPRGCI